MTGCLTPSSEVIAGVLVVGLKRKKCTYLLIITPELEFSNASERLLEVSLSLHNRYSSHS